MANRIVSGFLDTMSAIYCRSVAKRLGKYGMCTSMKFQEFSFTHEFLNTGLRYEDLLIETPEVLEATSRLPKDELHARTFRWARAQVHFKTKSENFAANFNQPALCRTLE
jgi:hypothetical protein